MHSHGMPIAAGTAGEDRTSPRALRTDPAVASKWIVAVLQPVRWTEEEAPSAAWTGVGARPGITAAAEIKACPLRVAAVGVEAA